MRFPKILVVASVVVFAICFDCLGQNDSSMKIGQFFVGFNYGTSSINAGESLAGTIASALVSPFSDVTERRTPSAGTFFLTGGFTEGDKFLIALAIGLERLPGEVIDNGTNQVVGTFYDQYFTAGLETSRVYGRGKTVNSKFYLYGVIGLAYVNRTKNTEGVPTRLFKENFFAETRLGVHVVPIAFSYGQRLRLNTEFGFGYRGIVSFTLHYRLQDYRKK